MATEPIKSGRLFLTRIYWLMFGPAFVILVALYLTNRQQRGIGFGDAMFWTGLLTIVWARWYEFRKGAALNGFGEPAQPEDLRRYVIGALVIGTVIWLTVKGVANFLPI